MPENADDKERRRFKSDTDRATVGRRHRSQHDAIPLTFEESFEDLTPPPQAPPKPESVAGYETLPPPVRHAIDSIHQATTSAVDAVNQIWPLRHALEQLKEVNRQFRELDHRMDKLAIEATRHSTLLEEFVLPATKTALTASAAYSRQLELQNAAFAQFQYQDLPKLQASIDGMRNELASVLRETATAGALVNERAKLAEMRFESVHKDIQELKGRDETHSVTIRSLEDSRLGWRVRAALVVAAVGAVGGIGAIAHWFIG